MAQKNDIQYVQYYIGGSAAPKYAPDKPKKKAPRHRRMLQKQTVIRVDPLALCSIAVAGVLLLAMLVGMIALQVENRAARQEVQRLEQLQLQNAELQQTYADGYDLEQIRGLAVAMGMIPAEQAGRVEISVEQAPPPPPEPSTWERICTFFAELFA